MFLKEIHVQNFKGFDDLHFSFTNEKGEIRKHTLLLGENGTGKSNLLKAIALVTASPDAILELLKQPSEWIKQGEDFCQITAKVNNSPDFHLEWRKGDSLVDIVKNEKNKLIKNTASSRAYLPTYAYGASRKLNYYNDLSSEPQENYKQSQNIANLFDNKHLLYSVTKLLIDLDYVKDKNYTILHKYDFAKEKINHFLRDIQFYEINPAEKRLYFKENHKILPLNDLSDGYQNMIALVGDLLARRFKDLDLRQSLGGALGFLSENFNNFPSLMLIDEIDLHLHPKWQRALLDFLAKELPSFQIIATTHSPLTAQQAGEGELFTLKKEDNGKVEVLPFQGSPDKLLLSDLLTAKDAFGLDTTESLKVENLKNRYRELKANTQNSENEQIELQKIQSYLQIIPNSKGSAYFSEEHYQLLQEIKAELKTR